MRWTLCFYACTYFSGWSGNLTLISWFLRALFSNRRIIRLSIASSNASTSEASVSTYFNISCFSFSVNCGSITSLLGEGKASLTGVAGSSFLDGTTSSSLGCRWRAWYGVFITFFGFFALSHSSSSSSSPAAGRFGVFGGCTYDHYLIIESSLFVTNGKANREINEENFHKPNVITRKCERLN